MLSAYQKWSLGALSALLALSALFLVHGLLPALLWASVVAIGLDPARANLLKRFPGKRTEVAGILVTAVSAIVILPLAFASLQAASEARQIAQWVQMAQMKGLPAPTWLSSVPYAASHILPWWNEHLATPGGAAREIRNLDLAMIAHKSQAIGVHLLSVAVLFGMIVTTLFFLLRDRDYILNQMRKACHKTFGEAGPRLGALALKSIRGTIDGVVLVGLAQGVLMGIVFAICGLPHPVLFGFLAAIGAMLPFGLVIATAIPAAILGIQGQMTPLAIMIALSFLSNFVADHYIRPSLIGGATKMPFMWVLLGLIGGIETLGLLGLFIGPAIMAVSYLLWHEYSNADDADL